MEEPEPTFDQREPADGDVEVDPNDLDEGSVRKFYVDDAEVWVTAEATYHLDAQTNRLRLVAYRDFVTETVRSLFPDPNELRSKWASRIGLELPNVSQGDM